MVSHLTPEFARQILEDANEISHAYRSESTRAGFDVENFQQIMIRRFPQLEASFPMILRMACSPKYDGDRLKFMLDTALRVRSGDLSQHDADVSVGQVLVDEIVKPQLKSNTRK